MTTTDANEDAVRRFVTEPYTLGASAGDREVRFYERDLQAILDLGATPLRLESGRMLPFYLQDMVRAIMAGAERPRRRIAAWLVGLSVGFLIGASFVYILLRP